jgi:oligopeptide/dipeptide ABC transporter ATP-binding protein
VAGDNPTLAVEDLKTYFFTKFGVVKAVDGVSFTVERGNIMGLVGESGCSKTVTGFSIIGLVDAPGRVVNGRIRFNGDDLLALPEHQMQRLRGTRIAMIFQDPMMTLNPVLRIDTQMIETIRAHEKVSREEAWNRSRDALGKIGMATPEERLKAYPHQFSGGQRQRIGIARALAVQPEFIVCDEAVAALDVSIQAQVLNLFMKLRKELALTYLFISHDIGVVEHLADRVAIMYLGRIVELAPSEELFEKPNHPYTRALLHEVPRLDIRRRKFEPIKGEIPSPLNPPTGCHFHPRCPFAMKRCPEERPLLKEIAPGWWSACHLND